MEIQRVQEIWQACRQGHKTDGPWLFGQFSIADCMFAPVALRFITYDTNLTDICAAYVRTVAAHPAIGEWVESARSETEIIEAAEIRTDE